MKYQLTILHVKSLSKPKPQFINSGGSVISRRETPTSWGALTPDTAMFKKICLLKQESGPLEARAGGAPLDPPMIMIVIQLY